MAHPERSVDILLVGGGVASARCARALRRHGFAGSILLVGDEHRVPYNRPPLSKELLRDDLPDELLEAEPAAWYERRGIDLLLDLPVTAIDPDAGRAALADGSSIRFARCLLATGAEVRELPVPGGERALTLRVADDARRLRAAALDAGPGAPVVVAGGGFIGLEVASGLARLGLRPTVVEVSPRLWGGSLGVELAAWAAERLGAAGIQVRLGAAVTRLADAGAWVGEDRLDAAFVVAGIGVRPRAAIAEGAGLRVADGIAVDRGQRTSHPAIWAAGDVARVDGRRVEHWHAAREAGERAALSMLGLPVPEVPASWVFSEVGDVTLDVIGAVDGWDEERWVGASRSVIAYGHGGTVVGIASIGGALRPEEARALVQSRASLAEVALAAG